MSNVKLQMSNLISQTENVNCQMSNEKCQISNIKTQTAYVNCQMSNKMSNVNRSNNLSERACEVSPVIFLLTQQPYEMFSKQLGPMLYAAYMKDQHCRAHTGQCKYGCIAICHSLHLLAICSYY